MSVRWILVARRACSWLSLGALFVACNRPIASDDVASPRPVPPRADRGSHTGDDTPVAEPAAPSTSRADRVEHMHDHLDVAGQARDAIVMGNLELAQGPLIWLGQHGYRDEVPAAYTPYLTAMQDAARRAGDAASLEVVASDVAAMAATCGNCHSAISPPVFQPHAASNTTAPTAARSVVPALAARMHVHDQASARLWDGLVIPSDAAWKEGAMLLGEVAFSAGLSRPMQPALREMGELGLRAAAATGNTRSQLYGEILARCGSCHVRLAVAKQSPEHHRK
jgi:hypothetical protein